MTPQVPERVFIPSRLQDNPYLNYESYAASLQELDPVERARLLEGDWDVRAKGSMLDRFDMPIVDDYPRDAQVARYWDLASTDELDADDPDWTAGARCAWKEGQLWIVHVERFRENPGGVENRIKQRAELDGQLQPVLMEREGGATGKATAHHYRRRVLQGFAFYDLPKRNNKREAARPLSAAAKNGNVFVVRGDWNADWFDEADMFPQEGFHDDQVDAVSGCMNWLSGFDRAASGGLEA